MACVFFLERLLDRRFYGFYAYDENDYNCVRLVM